MPCCKSAEWFFRVSGICLDLLTLTSVAGLEWAEPARALREGGGRGASLLGSFEVRPGCVPRRRGG